MKKNKYGILTTVVCVVLPLLVFNACSEMAGSKEMRPNDLSEKQIEAMLNLLVRAYRENLDLVMRENFYTETYFFDPIAMESYHKSRQASAKIPEKMDKPLVTLSAVVLYVSQKEREEAKKKITRALKASSITWDDNGKQINVSISEFEFLYQPGAVPTGSFASLDKFTVIPRKVVVK